MSITLESEIKKGAKIKQRSLPAITLQGAIEKTPILQNWKKYNFTAQKPF